MAGQTNPIEEAAERVLEITRVFDAPPSLVFRAWVEPEHIARWQGPRGFSARLEAGDFRPGGSYCIYMRGPENDDHWLRGTYREIREPERLVFTSCWTDRNGKPNGPETTLTLTFEPQDGKTKFTLKQTGFESVTARDLHRGGWSSALDCLEEYLAEIS